MEKEIERERDGEKGSTEKETDGGKNRQKTEEKKNVERGWGRNGNIQKKKDKDE